MSERAIRSVAIAGGGIVGLSAALAFRQALPRATITVIAIPVDPASLADRMPTAWPSVTHFHALIGVDEPDLLRSGIAMHHVGTIFDDWPDGRSWVHGFGPHGKPVGSVHFDQIWLQAHNAGNARRYEEYSAAGALSRAGKFVHPSRDPQSVLGSFRYGLRLDPELYHLRLRDRVSELGVRLIDESVKSVVHAEAGRVAALLLNDTQRVEADLFVDCTGPTGLLIGSVDGLFDEWPSHPASQLLIDSVESDALTPVARVTATRSGWTAEWPLGARTLRCAAGCGCDIPEAIAFRAGRRTAWTGNVLALGDSAIAIDPLLGLNLALVHRAIFLALELLPGRDFNPLELAEFNRRWFLITDQVRDLMALFYMRTRGALSGPASLVHRVDQYEHRGRLPFQEDELLNRDDWTSALLGMGIIPRNVDPAASTVPLDQATAAMNTIADELAAFASRAPAYPDYLARITRAS
jgi:tryptophan halogenase